MFIAMQRPDLVDDLHCVEGKAELIDGTIVCLPASGILPSRIAFEIAVALDNFAKEVRRGTAYNGSIAFIVPKMTSGRESFSPDASYYVGAHPKNEADFIAGPPTFAVEVRSKSDYGTAADRAYAAKRADYFEAGTLVVWDVDYRAEVIRKYATGSVDFVEFLRGDVADAEPAVPGWIVLVDDVFGPLNPDS